MFVFLFSFIALYKNEEKLLSTIKSFDNKLLIFESEASRNTYFIISEIYATQVLYTKCLTKVKVI